jgi:hypothetical protein
VLRSILVAKPPAAPAATPVTGKPTEPQLLRQLDTQERPETFVRWDLACLYATTARFGEALLQVRHLVELATTPEQKASYYRALGQLLELRQHFADAATCYLGAVEANPADLAGLHRLETFLQTHPAIRHRIPDLIPRLWKCRMAIERAARYGVKAATPLIVLGLIIARYSRKL